MKINKQIILPFILTLLTNIGFGQSQKSFDKLISETNKYLKVYDTIYTSGNYLLSNFDLSKKQIKDFLEAGYDGTSPTYKDSISGFTINQYFIEKILSNLKKTIYHNKFKDNKIIELLKSSSLSIVKSDDDKLYNFSLDEKNIGAYVFDSMMHYTEIPSDSLPTQEEIDKGIKISPYITFGNINYNSIYSIKTKKVTKYVLIGYDGCSSIVKLVSFRNGTFKQDFTYPNPLKSCWDGEVSYNQKSKIITIDYTTYGLTTDCDCTNYAESDEEQDNYYSDNEEIEQINKRCHCTFEFNGLNFELIKKSWEKIKE